jgi:hypothetical protein
MQQPWTHEDRNSFINHAVTTSTYMRGHRGNYHFSVMPKVSGFLEHDDPKKTKVTEILADTIYNAQGGRFRAISMKICDLIQQKITNHPQLSAKDITNIAVVIKGSNAYAVLLSSLRASNNEIANAFPHSDLDIVILINPRMHDVDFERIKSIMHTIVVQSMSQYKRLLDHMLFLNKPFPNIFLSQQDIDAFKAAFGTALDAVDPLFMSPFSSDAIRNSCSRNSFIIAESQGHNDSVVRVEVPHFEMCECIPLRKTPLFCSYNETLEFDRASAAPSAFKAKFNLYRMKMNVMYLSQTQTAPPAPTDESSTEDHASNSSDSMREERVTADFIDISIASKLDSELIDFWNHGRCITMYDLSIQNWIWVPDLFTCIGDLYKMLYVYDCPESKRDKRLKKYELLRQIANSQISPIM